MYHFLDALSPFATQASWDNSGLLIGTRSDAFDRIYLSLDVDRALVEEAEEHSLIITHHPLIFSGLKQLDFARYPSNLIQTIVRKNIALIAMHTNFDLSHLNAYVARKLGFEIALTKDFVAYCDVDESFEALAC